MTDAIDLLYPALDGERAAHVVTAQRERARHLVRFLQVLAHDGRASGSPRVALDPERAAGDLEGQARRELGDALEDLLRHYLGAVLDASSFQWFGEPELDAARAWSRLEAQRTEWPALPELPAPGEEPLEVARRLAEALDRLAVPAGRVVLWCSRVEQLARDSAAGSAGGERARGDEASEAPPGDSLALERLADRVARALDRGDVRAAGELLARGPLGVPGRTRPRHRCDELARWVELLADPGSASTAGEPPRPALGPVPRPLVELREERPELLPHLAGRPASSGRAARRRELDLRSLLARGTFGASLLEWVRFDGSARTVHLDAESAVPPLDGAVGGSRPRAPWEVAGEPENELLRGARVVLRRAGPCAPLLREALLASTRALALAPCHDERGALLGWLRIEWPHGLAWERAALERAARGGAALLAQPCASCGRGLPARALDGPAASPPVPVPALEEGASDGWPGVAAELVRELGMKLRHRRFWLFVPDRASGLACVAAGGGGLALGPAGGGSALAGARLARGTVVIDEPAPERTLARDAASALYVPIELARRQVAIFACESERRRDFRPADVERWEVRLADRALALHLVELGAWHRERFGGELAFAARSASFAARAQRVLSLARATGPVTLCGPAGAGKRVLARWLHFHGRAGPDGPFTRVEARADARAETVLPEPWPRTGGSLLVAHAERLSPRDQARLSLALEEAREDGDPRLFVTLPEAPAVHAQRGELAPGLALRLERAWLAVPALCERRDELAELLPRLVARVARDEGLEPVRLEDDALACLWRQPWPGGFVELENALYKLALDREGEAVDEARLRETLEVYGGELLRRLPSRHPRRADVEAALVVTRRDNGRWNKTRAALYLGWDPDTLVARMKELELDLEGAGNGEEGRGAGG